MKEKIRHLVADALSALDSDEIDLDAVREMILIERARDVKHGDFACNIAMRLSKPLQSSPREIAQKIINALPDSDFIQKTDIAGPGFINFTLSASALEEQLGEILSLGDEFGRTETGQGTPVLVEFVSANPTGPLHVGHGRLAAYGDCLARLLDATGYRVEREYYVNDAGRQMNILALSVLLRLIDDESQLYPSNAYRGGYIRNIAADLGRDTANRYHVDIATLYKNVPQDAPAGDKEKHVDGLIENAQELLGKDGFRDVLDFALDRILADIANDLEEFGVHPDHWFSEHSLAEQGAIQHALDVLEKNDRLYRKDGALWFKATEFGDEKDRVVVRENGQSTYFASDIAYHLQKRERGFEILLDVLGADHHGYIARIAAGLEAMGEPGDSLEVRLVQFVALYRGGEKMQMSTRSGQFITLRELREEVGNDAARFFYIMRSYDQHLDFDLELAKSKSNENPVYYIQYAHARVCSVFRQLDEKDLVWNRDMALASLARLVEPHEKALIGTLTRLPEVIELAATSRAPHTLAHFLRDAANDFHAWYNAHTFIVDDEALRNARLALCLATRQVLRNGLDLLGVSAPERM